MTGGSEPQGLLSDFCPFSICFHLFLLFESFSIFFPSFSCSSLFCSVLFPLSKITSLLPLCSPGCEVLSRPEFGCGSQTPPKTSESPKVFLTRVLSHSSIMQCSDLQWFYDIVECVRIDVCTMICSDARCCSH